MSAVHPDNDFLAMEPHLVERLKAALAELSPAVHVLTGAELADVTEGSQPMPAVHIVYGGFRPFETRGDGRVAKLLHTWLAVTVARNVSGTRGGAAARRDASALMARVGAALTGFVPPGTKRPLLLAPGPGPVYRTGIQYLPLAFQVESMFHATP